MEVIEEVQNNPAPGPETQNSESPQPPAPEPFKPKKKQRPADSWLADDPDKWRGRKIRKRASAALYVVRQVFVHGRVELEKGWSIYVTDVETVRADYDAYI